MLQKKSIVKFIIDLPIHIKRITLITRSLAESQIVALCKVMSVSGGDFRLGAYSWLLLFLFSQPWKLNISCNVHICQNALCTMFDGEVVQNFTFHALPSRHWMVITCPYPSRPCCREGFHSPWTHYFYPLSYRSVPNLSSLVVIRRTFFRILGSFLLPWFKARCRETRGRGNEVWKKRD